MLQKVDHIIYAVADLDQSVKKFKEATDLQVFPGGEHQDRGTHNAILRIGDKTYLEFLAKKKSSQPFHSQTWMGLDLLQEDKITRWSLASDNVEQESLFLKKFKEPLANIVIGSRAKKDGSMLNWLMTSSMPAPEVEPAPFLIDWKNSVHPTAELPLQCKIKSFSIEHSESDLLKKLLEKLACPLEVYTANESSLKLTLETPKGIFTL